MPDALQCIESLVKIRNKFDHISVSSVQETAQKQPKIVLSAGVKTFEISKLENYKNKWNLAQICIIWTPLIHQNMRVSIYGRVVVGI